VRSENPILSINRPNRVKITSVAINSVGMHCLRVDPICINSAVVRASCLCLESGEQDICANAHAARTHYYCQMRIHPCLFYA
jgi:hypothetical protein